MSCSRHSSRTGSRGPVEEAVGVLHAGDPGGQRLAELAGRDVAQPDAADLARVAQRGQLRELVVEVDQLVALGEDAGRGVEAAQVDHADPFDAERGEVGLDLGAQLRRALGGDQRAVGVPGGPDLAHQDKVVGVGRQRGADQGVAVAVELRGVDVVDARADRLAQDRQRRVPVAGGRARAASPRSRCGRPAARPASAGADREPVMHESLPVCCFIASAWHSAEPEVPPVQSIVADKRRTPPHNVGARNQAQASARRRRAQPGPAARRGEGRVRVRARRPCRSSRSRGTPRSGSARSTGTSRPARRWSRRCTARNSPTCAPAPTTCWRRTPPSRRCAPGWTGSPATSAAKREMADTLRAVFASGAVTVSQAREELTAAVQDDPQRRRRRPGRCATTSAPRTSSP